MNSTTDASLNEKVAAAKTALDAHVREIVNWHFSPETGCPFWLEKAKSFDFNPLEDVKGYDDLKLFGALNRTIAVLGMTLIVGSGVFVVLRTERLRSG